MSYKKKLYVGKSRIHGQGLFTKVAIGSDEVLGYCKTRKARDPGLHTLTLDCGAQYDVTCKLKYINHSKQPNVIYYDDFSVMSLRDIDADEELTHDYGEEWD